MCTARVHKRRAHKYRVSQAPARLGRGSQPPAEVHPSSDVDIVFGFLVADGLQLARGATARALPPFRLTGKDLQQLVRLLLGKIGKSLAYVLDTSDVLPATVRHEVAHHRLVDVYQANNHVRSVR